MNGPQSRQIIVVGMAGAGALSAVRSIRQGHAPRIAIFAGALLSGIVLAMLSEVSPDVAGGLALVVFLTSILTSGEVFDAVTAVLGSATSAPAKPATPYQPAGTPANPVIDPRKHGPQ